MTIKLAATVVAGLACAASAASAQANLTAEAGAPGTVSYLAPVSLAEFVATSGIADIQVKEGQTLTNSVQNVAEGRSDISASPFIVPFLMSRGVGPYSNIGAEEGAKLADNLRVLYPYTFGVFFLYAYNSQGITGWDDLAGRRVLNGPPQGAATGNSRTLIQLVTGMNYETDYESVTVSWGQAVNTITDGTADAALLPELFPSGRPTQMSAAGDMTAYSIPREAFERESMQNYLRAPGNAPWEMPVADAENLGEAWTVQSEDDTFRGMAVVGGELARADLDEELAYQLVRVHIENLDAIRAKAPFAEFAGFGVLDAESTGLCGPNPLRYHPGAVRAWEEAGYIVPDCAKP